MCFSRDDKVIKQNNNIDETFYYPPYYQDIPSFRFNKFVS